MSTARAILLLAACCILAAQGRPGREYRKMQTEADVGHPLILTPYIERGDLAAAREASSVRLEGMRPSYSGFTTVDKAAGSNLFFWFFPEQQRPSNTTAPLILWLQGGPGASGMYGSFVEVGPYAVDETSSKLLERDVHWNRDAALLFVDSPVGAGFSFTEQYEAFARNETQIAKGLMSMLQQVLILFPEYQQSDLFIFGESYGGGKYAPGLAYQISKFNAAPDQPAFGASACPHHINLKGLGLGDPGVADPAAQFPTYADELYNMGLVDLDQREQLRSIFDRSVQLTNAGNYSAAFALWDSVWGDIGDEKYPSLFTNFTFSTYTENQAFSAPPKAFGYYADWINSPEVRRAIHVGSLPFGGNSSKVYNILAYEAGEFCGETLTEVMVDLLKEYRVLVYAGAYDPLLGPALAEAWLTKILGLMGKQAADMFAKTPRHAWRLSADDTEVAGYARELENLTYLVVRNAGHIVPYDQPDRAFDMMQRMLQGRSFVETASTSTMPPMFF